MLCIAAAIENKKKNQKHQKGKQRSRTSDGRKSDLFRFSFVYFFFRSVSNQCLRVLTAPVRFINSTRPPALGSPREIQFKVCLWLNNIIIVLRPTHICHQSSTPPLPFVSPPRKHFTHFYRVRHHDFTNVMTARSIALFYVSTYCLKKQ